MSPKSFLAVAFSIVTAAAVSAREPSPAETWPGFRGHDMNGVAPTAKIPDRWTTKENVKWSVPIAGHGWSSPIVSGDTVFVTSAISSRPFKKPTPGLYGNDYIADMQAQGLSDEEITKRAQARDNELTAEADEIRYMVYALDARTGKIKWAREAVKAKALRRASSQEHLRIRDAVHRRRAALRVVRIERRPVRVLAGRQVVVEEAVAAARDLSRLRHGLVAHRRGRARLPAAGQRGSALQRCARREDRCGALAHAAGGRGVSAEVVVDDAVRLEERAAHRDHHDRPGRRDRVRRRREGTLARRPHVDADGVAVRGRRPALRRDGIAG